ncbi:HisA/HisF-related TIM barrel protein [Ferroacidibacillus organovorans]|uniref:1-(5-phosphoribosyl)-5-[(5-phosphoribosylamino)methylideneamino] imidazole-4-carboxamide isomerase n=1 Tax=Ferroacidibacillus organovorans TaxID=1765683 RepID=A0A162SV04_9BACL|nr:HisA/HisF-related TIM barrel protein [Ferroacidibacillus organovorans]KYP80176.1 hypothetical protein AYJ22_02755 [Ferroacidibacillus organovorans]OAG95053.1 hypothetical protein AYW79_02230 [Ferroacidibacillus organovorans]OPG17627.1 hypothetical protein B2M26_00270 [Ferroacidibacillus organovorans]
MYILPAIDLLSGDAVRLYQGDYERVTSYGDPHKLARSYREDGATHLHIVDLDAARSGTRTPQTAECIREILEDTGLYIELGGGIRTEEDIEYWLKLGVWRVVLGTVAARAPEVAGGYRKTYGKSVTVGIDARNGKVATAGWLAEETLEATALAKALCEFGFEDCIHTDISKDGTLAGASLERSVELSKCSGLSVIVSGGVKDLADVRQIIARADAGVSGVILGKALLDGRMSLRDALNLTAGEVPM